VVQRAWHCPLRNASPFARLDWLFRNTARFLKSWSDRFIGNVRLQLTLANKIVARLEAAMDRRNLASYEESLRKELKLKAFPPFSARLRGRNPVSRGSAKGMPRHAFSMATLMRVGTATSLDC
jgi:hypothetical protein